MAAGVADRAAVFPTPTIARTLVRLAWDEWPLDRFFPILYRSFHLEDIPWIGDARLAALREALEWNTHGGVTGE